MRALPILAALTLAACTAHAGAPATPHPAASPMSWRSLATPDDRKRLRDWRSAWGEALGKAKAGHGGEGGGGGGGGGHGGEVAGEGALLDPDAAALGEVMPPPGNYRCRVVKLGGQSPEVPDYVAYGPFACRVGPAAAAAGAAAAARGAGGRG